MPTTPFKIGVLASGNGTDLKAVMDEMSAGKMPGIHLALVISNKADAGALEKAQSAGVPGLFLDPKNTALFPTQETYDAELVRLLQEHSVDLVCLMGYMKILTPQFIQAFFKKIINVHPALLPKFGGKGFFGDRVHKAVLQSGETQTGCTIHYVEEGVDTGEIIAQQKVTVTPDDTPASIKEKVQTLEKKLYPQVIRQIATKMIKVDEK